MAKNKVCFDSTSVNFIVIVYWNCIILNNRYCLPHIEKLILYTNVVPHHANDMAYIGGIG